MSPLDWALVVFIGAAAFAVLMLGLALFRLAVRE